MNFKDFCTYLSTIDTSKKFTFFAVDWADYLPRKYTVNSIREIKPRFFRFYGTMNYLSYNSSTISFQKFSYTKSRIFDVEERTEFFLTYAEAYEFSKHSIKQKIYKTRIIANLITRTQIKYET